jgi:hypothetical protein
LPDRVFSGIWLARPKMYKNTRINTRKYEINIYNSHISLFHCSTCEMKVSYATKRYTLPFDSLAAQRLPAGLFDIMTMGICDQG